MTNTAQRTCLGCKGPCRYVLCDACYAVWPMPEPETSRVETARVATYGLPVSVGGVHRF